MNKKFKSLSGFIIFILSPFVFLLLFQNCGKKFQSELGMLSSSSVANSEYNPNPITPNLPAPGGEVPTLPLKFGDVEVTELFRGDVIKLKISKRDPTFPDNFKITAMNANAEAYKDFIPFEKQLTIEPTTGSVDLQIETMITEPFANAKELTLKIEYTHFTEAKSFLKKILIKSRYEPVRYKSIKAGYSHMCGLGFDDELYCWGSLSGSRLFFSSDRQPFRIKSGTVDKIDFNSLQIADSHTCFKVIPSDRLHCFGSGSLNSVAVKNVSLSEVTLTANSQLIDQPIKDYAANGYMVYFITIDGQLYSRNLNNMGVPSAVTTLINQGTKYLKVYADKYSSLIAVNEAGEFELNYGDTTTETSKRPLFSAQLDYRNIVHSDSLYFFTNDNKQVTKPGYNDIYIATDLPAAAKSFSSGATAHCFTTIENKLYCRKNYAVFQLLADLTVEKLSPNTATVRQNSVCSLNQTGQLKCLGKDADGYYTGSFGFAANAANPEYVDVTEGQIAAYEALVAKPAYNPLFSVSDNEIKCQMDGYQFLNCTNLFNTGIPYKKIFGNNRIKTSSVKAYLRDGAVFAETLSGRRLAYYYHNGSSSVEFFTVNKITSGRELVAPGPIEIVCPEGMTKNNDGCQFTTTVTVAIANPGRLIQFPSSAETVEFDIVLVRPAPVDLIFSVETDLLACGGTPTLSASCFPLLNTLCTQNSCMASELSAGWANSRAGVSGGFNRFDWNFDQIQKFVLFKSGETRSRYSLKISKDIRKEQNRLIHLKLSSTLQNVVFADSIQILLRKNQNPEPPGGVMTFAQLMDRQYGIMGLNCVKCHNSVDMHGGFDMTNYDLMVSRGVINLSDLMQSKINRRIDPTTGSLDRPMPLDGFMPMDKTLEIQKWIQNGAKNN